MPNPKIDNNFKETAFAITNEANPSVATLLVEPLTNRLEIEVSVASSFNDVLAEGLKEDANYEPVSKAVTDDTAKDIRLLKVDSSNRLIIDLEIL